MFKLFKNRENKKLYKKYADCKEEEREKVLADVVEKYKSLPEKEKEGFRRIIAGNVPATPKNGAEKTLQLAKEIGKATEWKDAESDSVLAEAIKKFVEKEGDARLAIAALDALYENNYGEAEFWEKMLYKDPQIARFVVERISGVDGAEEVFKRNLGALIPLLDENRTCREMAAKYLNCAKDEIKMALVGKIISTGIHDDLLGLIPELFDSKQARYKLLGWLGRANIRIKTDADLPPAEKIPLLAKKIKEMEKKLVEKAIALLPQVTPAERLLLHHFLLTRGVRTREMDSKFLTEAVLEENVPFDLRKTAAWLYKNENDRDEMLERKMEGRIKELMESAQPNALIKAYESSMLLAVLNREKGIEMLQSAYKEAVDVLEDDGADMEQKENAASVCFHYITKFSGRAEEFKDIYKKAAAVLNAEKGAPGPAP